MENTLVPIVQATFTQDTIAQLARDSHVSDAEVRAGLYHSVPFALHILLSRVEGPYGPEMFWQLSREANTAGVLQHLTTLAIIGWQKRGDNLLHDLLGDAYAPAVQEQATAADISVPLAAALLSCSTVAVLGLAGRHAQQQGLDPARLAVWLRQEREPLHRAMLSSEPEQAGATPRPPIGRSMAPYTMTPEMAAFSATTPAWPPPAERPAETSTARWQWGLLLLLAVLLGYLFGHDRLGTSTSPRGSAALAPAATPALATAATAGRYDDASGNYIYDTGQPLILRLADGTTQKVGANSTENRLFTFLADPAVEVDSVNRTKGWINFDRVYFEPGSTLLTDESYQQLRNVASILKTFPASVVKIGGYTDSTGAALKNFQLSEERAKTAMLAIANAGVDINRLQAKGYGGKYFITPNTTPEGRALNRRISIRVIKK